MNPHRLSPGVSYHTPDKELAEQVAEKYNSHIDKYVCQGNGGGRFEGGSYRLIDVSYYEWGVWDKVNGGFMLINWDRLEGAKR